MRDDFDPHGGNFLQRYPHRDLDRGEWEPVPLKENPFVAICMIVLLVVGAAVLLFAGGCSSETPTECPPPPPVFCLTVTTSDSTTTSVTADNFLLTIGRERHVKAWLRGEVVGWFNDVIEYDATAGACER